MSNRYVYHYCAVNENLNITMSGIARLNFRIVSQNDLDELKTAVSNDEFTANAINSLSYLGREHEQTD